MEISDELMTPGCPNCFIKHMSTALSLVADGMSSDVGTTRADVLLARAVVNFTEVAEGYLSHYYFAIGLMNRAETAAVADGDVETALFVRGLRSDLQCMDPAKGAETAVAALADRIAPGAFVPAHYIEASRELPSAGGVAGTGYSPDGMASAIEDVFRTYFSMPELPEKGGESTMACGTKAACKGGKCSAPKGGKKGGKKGCCK